MTSDDPTPKLTAGVTDESAVFAEGARRVVTAVQLSPAEVEGHYQKIQSRLGRLEALDERATLSVSSGYTGREGRGLGFFNTHPLRRWLWSATVMIALAAVVIGIRWNALMHRDGRYATTSMLTYTTANGERATIALPDGGTVVLNVASRLEVPLNYMAGNHTVRLIGEGLFSVPHHEGAPFTVIVGATTARVLGTSFVVRRYPSDTMAVVAVRDGKVAVGSAVATAAQLIEVGRDGLPHLRPSDASSFTFATGTLTIDGMPLPAAITELDRWYDADVRLGDPALARLHVKGEFVAGSLADLTAILEGTFQVRAVRDGRMLTLYPR